MESWGTNNYGAMKCRGNNNHGQLGDNSTTFRRTPVSVQGLSDVELITAGDLHSCALKTDSAAWCWGYNVWCQLGNRPNEESLVQVQVLP